MFILTNHNDEIIYNSPALEYYHEIPIVLSIEGNKVAVSNHIYKLCKEVDTVPADYIPHKYCFTDEAGIYANPNYNGQDASMQEEIEQAYRDKLAQEVRNNVDA